MTITTNAPSVRASISAGNWDIVWGDPINEYDALTFLVSLPTGTVLAWVAEQVEVQLQQFAQNSKDVSGEVLDQAATIVEDICTGKRLGRWDIEGLEIKGGVATYHRWGQFSICGVQLGGKKRLPNHYQPYIGLRVKQPLPPKGASAMPKLVCE